jgi:predicted AlkP superfamily pyrophosphatase or phosphodiesterase
MVGILKTNVKLNSGDRAINLWRPIKYGIADFSVTPRPNYLADGRKIPDIYSEPSELRDHLQKKLGTFPLFHFWGPKTSIKSSQWIADATIETDNIHDPTLTLVYLPHLDYNLQRHGLNFDAIAEDLKEIDKVVEQLVTHYQKQECHIILLSEYGITNVNKPIHLNRILRANGYIAIRIERGLELLDAGASKAFAVADHQVAHVYLNDKSLKEELRMLLEDVDGVQQVLDEDALADLHLNHDRAGDLVVVADKDSWFTYYFWTDDAKAPDYARMVDIHKKPGYDPVEMFTDPSDKFLIPKVIGKLIRKKLGFRTIMDIIPLKAELVKGSHGRVPEETDDYPVFISTAKNGVPSGPVSAVEVYTLIEKHILDDNSTE